MSTYEFPKHPDTELVESQKRARIRWENALLQYPASVYGILTFPTQPPDPETVLARVRSFARHLSGRLRRRVMWLAVAERGTVLDRLHSHVLLWSQPLHKRIHLCGHYWIEGYSEFEHYRPGGGAESYIAGKIARGEVWECSKKLAQRLGPFMGSDVA